MKSLCGEITGNRWFAVSLSRSVEVAYARITSLMNNAIVAWPLMNNALALMNNATIVELARGVSVSFCILKYVTIRLSIDKHYKFVIFTIHVKQEILLGCTVFHNRRKKL